MKKNLFLAFLLGFIPGIGHLYMNRPVRSILYGFGFWFPAILGMFIAVAIVHHPGPLGLLIISSIVWVVSMIDLTLTISAYDGDRRKAEIHWNQTASESHAVPGSYSIPGSHAVPGSDSQKERFLTILLSIIPGLGHFQMGLMNRGLALLIGFFGLTTMVIFVAAFTHRAGFLVFLGALPIIWLYSMFDSIQLLNRKQRGEVLEDRSILEDLEKHREEGKKSRTIATILSVFPGAGHMYLGLQRRGLQLMAAFLFSFYILDALRLTFFLFLVPIIWCFSLFDALQKVSNSDQELGRQEDVPVIEWMMNHQKWMGIGLLSLGGFYLIDKVLLNILQRQFPDINFYYYFENYFQTSIVSILLIAGGLKLLIRSKGKREVDRT